MLNEKHVWQNKEKWKDQVVAKQNHQDVQLKTFTFNNNKVAAEVNEKRNEI